MVQAAREVYGDRHCADDRVLDRSVGARMRVRDVRTWVGIDGFAHAEMTVDAPNGAMQIRLDFEPPVLDRALLELTRLAMDVKAAAT